MNSLLDRQLWSPLVWVPWALLAGLLLAPSPAWAQCGHYVLVGGRSMSDVHHADAQAMSGNKATLDDSSVRLPMQQRIPCSGPGCEQGRPTSPLAPVAPP